MTAPAAALPQEALDRRRRDLADVVWEAGASLRLTIPLLFLIAAACTLGTFANPENRPMTEIRAAIGHAWYFPAYVFFGLNDLFHSWWFVLLLVLLTLNLTACTIERLPRIFQIALRPNKRLADAQLRGIQHVIRLRAAVPPANAAAEAAALLRARGFTPELLEAGEGPEAGTAFVFAEKGRYSRFGVWIVHLSLFLILGGALAGRLWGKEGSIDVPQDGGTFDFIFRKTASGTVYKEPLGFTVRVDDFRLLRYTDGSPRSYESDLSVLGPGGRTIEEKTIRVGEPLVHGGWTFYQASYQADPSRDRVKIEVTELATRKKTTAKLEKDGAVTMPGGTVFKAVNYTDRFESLGPALQIERTAADGSRTSFWVFQRYPDFDARNRGGAYGLAFDGMEPFYETGLQVARDPGYLFWLAGCVVLFLGLTIAFYTSHRRLWLRVRPDGEVVLAGAAHKNKEAFAKFFADLAAALGKAKGLRA